MVEFSETERKERMDTSSLMGQILCKENLNTAYLQVVRNKGAEPEGGVRNLGVPTVTSYCTPPNDVLGCCLQLYGRQLVSG